MRGILCSGSNYVDIENKKIKGSFFSVFIITTVLDISLFVLYASNIYSPIVLVLAIIFQSIFFVSVMFFLNRFEKIKTLAVTDPLTNIYNRSHFFDVLENEIEKRNRHNGDSKDLSMIMFDIDDFKKINDKFGHYSGDKVILEIVSIVKNIIRPYDTFARVGGEEFAVILNDIKNDASLQISERIRKTIADRLKNGYGITISIGIANFEKGDSADTLYKKADDAMYHSKLDGKDKVTIWLPSVAR